MPHRRLLVGWLGAALVLAGCGGGGGRDEAAEAEAVERAVRGSIAAENAGDASAFLRLWTDDGLRSYDAGSRADLESGRARLGGEQTEVRDFVTTTVDGGKAVTTVDTRVEIGLYRVRFTLVRQDGRWMLDGFRFLGPTPPPAETKVVEVRAVEYAFEVDTGAMAAGDFAIRFVGAGQEQHELSLFSVPEQASTAEAVFSLSAAPGGDFSRLPEGYRLVGHLAFAAPGDDLTYTLAERLAPGRYAMACFLPVGGLSATGAASSADAEPHVARGMLTPFTVG